MLKQFGTIDQIIKMQIEVKAVEHNKNIEPFLLLSSDVICPDKKEQNGLDGTSQEALCQG